MLTLYIDEDSKAGKSLIEYALKLKAPKAIKIKRSARKFTDEEMALPGIVPTKEELEEWLTRPDKDRGSSAALAKKRMLERFRKNHPATKLS